MAAGEYASASEAVRDLLRVWHRQRLEDAERLDAIRMRVRRSVSDPRPDLASDEIAKGLAELFAQAERDTRRA